MMKKTGVMVLALVAVLACSLAMVSEPADAVDRDIQLSIGTANSQPGATSVAVDLTIDKNVGFFGTQISIDYDSHLTLTSVVPASIIDVTYSIGNGTCDIYLESKELADSTAVGTVLTLYFTVSSSATDEMPIAFDKVTMFNYDEIELFPLTVDGKITIGEGSVPVTGVALDKKEATMDVGESITLTPIVAPSNATNKNVTWSSTDSSVATVSNGVVKAVKYGSAIIIATTVDGGKAAACTITVAEPTTHVTGVTLNKSSMTITAGTSDSLVATVSPDNASNKSINWTSTNPSIVVVNDGVVTGVKEGSAVVIATTVDGGKTATCAVTVEKAPAVPVPVTGVTLNTSSITIEKGKTQTLVATVSPDNATNKGVVWSSNDTSVATVSNGVVTAVGAGSTTITVTSVSGGQAPSCSVTVKESSPSGGDTGGDNTMLYLGIVIVIILVLLVLLLVLRKSGKI